MNALDYAIRMIAQGVRESHGKNRSPIIDTINTRIGIPLGSPYCAAGVSFCFIKAKAEIEARNQRLRGDTFPYSGSSQAIKRWFNERGLLTYDPTEMLGWGGAIFGWTNKDNIHGHVGFVRQRLSTKDRAGNLKIVRIATSEFNTNPQTKGRDGQGAYNLIRDVPIDGNTKLWFCDTSKLVAGIWWVK